MLEGANDSGDYMLVYKYLSAILGVGLLIAGALYLNEKRVHASDTTALHNKVAELEGTVKEAKNAVSTKGIEVDGLKASLEVVLSNNKQLLKSIKDRDESIVALNEVVLRWKNKYFEIKNATETTVETDGTTTAEVPVECQSCLKNVRSRVDFDQTQDAMRVYGYTLTNPAYANVSLEWVKDVNLTLILVRNKQKHFKVYLDSKNSDFVPAKLSLMVDPSVFEKKWYEKIAISTSASVGNFVVGTNLAITYDVWDDIFVGPNFVAVVDGNGIHNLYGFSVGFYPFR